ncbi:hypothetical protein BKA70DRAFT_1565806 [Coprinopsis sp. MPI-PUGE-AT-0042]|nr:hypothetical protein BKA70DRAFT_1565806 [Coprinopsis sp. MPI-PUGE-AT-0042]
MKLSPDFQLSSSLSAAEIEKTQAWVAEAISDYEKRDPNIVAKVIAEDAVFHMGSLGPISGAENIRRLFEWVFQATEGATLNSVVKSVQVTSDQLVVVVDGEYVYPDGTSDRWSWRSNINKKIDSDKVTGATVSDTGAEPDIYPILRKKLPLPSFATSLQ